MKIVHLSLLLSGMLLAKAWAEEPIHFSDPKLKEAVEAELFISNPTPTDMLGLTELVIPLTWQRINAISDLTGLEYATNLTDLDLKYHKVSDLSPLSGLIHLRSVALLGNGLTDISPLSTLTELGSLDIESNEVTDISALSGLPKLASLCLHRNPIPDISPLTSLTSLQWLDLRALPLDQDAYDVYLPQIEANNPGITVLHDWVFNGQLLISSSIGGTVVDPGEGAFTFAFNQTLLVEAQADPGFVFIGWSGDLTSTENPLPLTMDQNYTLHANFASILPVVHVDDDAAADPGADNPAVSDLLENGTREHPFDSIREAIDVAAKRATIFVHAGTYQETIDFLGKQLELTGFDPNDPNRADWPVIDGNGNGPVVSFTHGEDKNCLLTGFVITGGKSRTGAAIRCTTSSPTISNCLIAGNRATDWNGTAVLCTDSEAAFINCTIVDNRGGEFGAGVTLMQGRVTMVNSILWNNWPKEVESEGDALPPIRYSVVAGGWPGLGNLKTDPLFANLGHWADRGNPAVTVSASDPSATWVMGDYHLQSQAGRWDPKTATWLQDEMTSPCIDGGDPATPIGQEPSPNGAIINMGAYGGTAQASKSRSGTL
jgi:uncharacterized repeat protein (TIGR02543 family)